MSDEGGKWYVENLRMSRLYIASVPVCQRKKTKSGLAAHKSMNLLSNISSSDASVKTKRR